MDDSGRATYERVLANVERVVTGQTEFVIFAPLEEKAHDRVSRGDRHE